MSKSILEVVNGMEYVDDELKMQLNRVFEGNADTSQEEAIEFVLSAHKSAIDQLSYAYSTVVFDNLRKLERMGRWTTLGYIVRAAKDSHIAALKNSSDSNSELAQILSESYELERQFSSLGLEDKQRVMNIYNNQ